MFLEFILIQYLIYKSLIFNKTLIKYCIVYNTILILYMYIIFKEMQFGTFFSLFSAAECLINSMFSRYSTAKKYTDFFTFKDNSE